MRQFLRAKIHKATVTEANLAYEGSITVDRLLLERVGIAEYEKVLVVDNTSGERLETYALAGEPGSGTRRHAPQRRPGNSTAPVAVGPVSLNPAGPWRNTDSTLPRSLAV